MSAPIASHGGRYGECAQQQQQLLLRAAGLVASFLS
jgi:hypothetical protein